MPWTRIAGVTGHDAGGGSGFTTDPVETGGGDLIIAVACWYSGVTSSITLSDSKTNTSWTAKTAQVTGGSIKAQLFYAWNAIVGSGHTFTVAGSTTFAGLCVLVFSGSKTTSDPFSDENGATATSVNTLGTGAAGASGNLAIAGLGTDNNDTKSIDLSFAKDGDVPWANSVNEGVAMAYKIQTGSDNPTWSWAGSTGNVDTVIATFLAAPAGAANNLDVKIAEPTIGSSLF